MQKDSPKRKGSLPNVVMHREKPKVYGSQEEPNPKGTCKGCLVQRAKGGTHTISRESVESDVSASKKGSKAIKQSKQITARGVSTSLG